MGRKLRQLAALLLAVLLLFPTSAVAATQPTGDVTMKIGLFYGGSALPGANLANKTGSGFRFGYFDENQQFWQVGYTAETKISVVKAQNVCFGLIDGVGNYSDAITSDIAVGGYHVQLPGSYAAFDGALVAAAQAQGGFPAWVEGTYYVRAGSYATQEAAAAVAAGISGATAVAASAFGVSVVKTGTSQILFQFDGGQAFSLGVKPGLDDGVKSVTIFKNSNYFGGFQYQRNGGNMTVLNVIPIEDYIKGVVVKEMSRSWPLEALKAQAVCARTYSIISFDNHKKENFNLCNTTHCQAYSGIGDADSHSDRAVDETAGKYARYQGALAQTYYYSCNGGATEDVQNVWGGKVPYLKGVADPSEAAYASKIKYHKWTVSFTKTELAEILRGKGYACADIVDFYVSERTPTGNVLSFTFLDAAGKKWTISNRGKELCRTMLGLRSINYSITGGGGTYYVNDDGGTLPAVDGAYAVDGSGNMTQLTGTPYVVTGSGVAEPLAPSSAAGDTFTLNGGGWGHLVGMSQWGAYAMATDGKTYDQILKFYYTGIDVQ